MTTQETNELWLHDVAEIFLGSEERDRRCYREFEVSPQGEWIDLDVDLRLVDHEAGWVWQSGIEVAARIAAAHHTWFGAMRIPMASLTQQVPFDGMTFRANLLRSQGPPERRVLLAWRAPMADTFHVPDRFGLLRLTL